MGIIEIEAAITQLAVEDVDELMSWLDRYRAESWDGEKANDLDAVRFDSIIAEAYASGEPSPLTKGDIDEARRIVKDRITARNSAT